ncbi:hypothetical protein HGG64_01545 [Mycoplasma phocoeninasale]|uniref:Uncharacterized protein n=1 Tax=Mycoplasma phocoeninasale TaxID=2726117 RepID=A0A858U342_9MOLU|nr:hypothetical protein [Mycoplasma phocoeninasale]QJG66391.1 hypothetical protein HGG64_01545 [Mycoplasma phocoeninasale]
MSHKRTKEREERERAKLNGWDHLDRSFYTVNYFSNDDLRERGISGEVKRINNMGGLTLGNWNAIEEKNAYILSLSDEILGTVKVDLAGLKSLNDMPQETKKVLLTMFENQDLDNKNFLGFWYNRNKKEITFVKAISSISLRLFDIWSKFKDRELLFDLKTQKVITKKEYIEIKKNADPPLDVEEILSFFIKHNNK